MRFRLSMVSTSFYRNFCLVAAGVDGVDASTLVSRRLATQKGPACMPRFSRLQCCPPAARGATHDWQRLQLGDRFSGRTGHASGAVEPASGHSAATFLPQQAAPLPGPPMAPRPLPRPPVRRRGFRV